jgi:hypothetical protein
VYIVIAPGAQGFSVAEDVFPAGPLTMGAPFIGTKRRVTAHTRRMARAVVSPALALSPGPLEEFIHERWRGCFRHKVLLLIRWGIVGEDHRLMGEKVIYSINTLITEMREDFTCIREQVISNQVEGQSSVISL